MCWPLLAQLFALFATPTVPTAHAKPSHEVDVYFFWRDGCRHCEEQKPLMERLGARERVRLHSHEVVKDAASRALFLELAEAHGFEPRGVPVTIVGARHWVGFHAGMEAELERAVRACLEAPCPDPRAPPDLGEHEASPVISVPWFGEVNLREHTLLVSTAIIAFVDGFNPCSLWVLTILLSLILHVRSRARILLVGLTFLTVTALVYGLFIAGLLKVFAFVKWIDGARVAVALFALFFALVNIKDYFWYQRGISFSISDAHKPTIYKRTRGILARSESAWAMFGATIVMALGVSIMELPCTAGFPILWSNMVAAHDVAGGELALLLGLYMLIYLLDELAVFITVVVTLRMSKMQEKHGRVLKLIGGGVMLALAVTLLVRPELMNDLQGSLLVFGAAFAGVALVLFVHRVVLPRAGIFIGSEKRPKRRPGGPPRPP
jgi:glutaredoxin